MNICNLIIFVILFSPLLVCEVEIIIYNYNIYIYIQHNFY